MKEIFRLFVALSIWSLALLVSCTPSSNNPVEQNIYKLLEQDQAITEWKKTVKESDECSSTYGMRWFAEHYLGKNWADCCIQHDFDYREGAKYGITKVQADYELWQCVDASGHPVVARFVYSGVRTFGFLFYKE